jgi:hypothetical protein
MVFSAVWGVARQPVLVIFSLPVYVIVYHVKILF